MDDPIVSVVRGKVIKVVDVYTKGFSGYGKCVTIQADASYGDLSGLFFFHGHCKEIIAKENADVEEGEVIAIAGNTDYTSTNPTSTYPVAQAHLHFEVSRTARGGPAIHERAPEYKDLEKTSGRPAHYCEDPREVLERLGPWGPRKVYFVNGQTVDEQSALALHEQLVSHDEGGYFPLGTNNLWHGGVHVRGARGSMLVAPLSGEIVACRLGESERSSLWQHGSVNFILLRHTLHGELNAKAEGKRAAAGKGVLVLKKGCTEPELVKELKSALNAAHDEAGASYYPVSSSAALEEGTFDQTLENAVKRFQGSVNAATGRPFMRRPDGKVSVPGLTWNALRNPPLQPAESNGAKQKEQAMYTLLMHLDAVPIESMREKAPWLTRVTVTPEKPPEPEPVPSADANAARPSVEDTSQDRDYKPTSFMGKERPDLDHEPWNAAADVCWLKRRLTIHGHYNETDLESGAVTPALLSAIVAFHQTQPEQFRAPKAYPYVARNGKGRQVLSLPKPAPGQTTAEAQRRGKKEPATLDPNFLKQLQVLDANELAQVVSGLSVKVKAGELLWTMGVAMGLEHGFGLPLVHWSTFSEEPLLTDFQAVADEDVDNVSITGCEQLMELTKGHDDFRDLLADGRIEGPELVRFYQNPSSAFLRRVRVKFLSEWAVDPIKFIEKLQTDPRFDLSTTLPEDLEPYAFWQQARDVLPKSPVVWHYHPVELMLEFARRTGILDATLELVVNRVDTKAGRVEVQASRGATRVTTRVRLGDTTQLRFSAGLLHLSVFAGAAGSPWASGAQTSKTEGPFDQLLRKPLTNATVHALHLVPGKQRLELLCGMTARLAVCGLTSYVVHHSAPARCT